MKSILILPLIFLAFIFASCSEETKHAGYVDQNEALVEHLSEVEGDLRTYNYDFKILEYPNVEAFYYKPIRINEALASIPDEMRNAIHLPVNLSTTELPFTPGTEKANIVTFWNDKNKLIFQIQIAYFENDAAYKADNKDFFVISATQLADNPFVDTSSDNDPIDIWMEELNINAPEAPDEVIIYKKFDLTSELPLFFKTNFQHWRTMYPYYSYNSDKEHIEHTSTGSKMYYAWHDGIMFQIGYKFADETIDMEPLVRKIILGE